MRRAVLCVSCGYYIHVVSSHARTHTHTRTYLSLLRRVCDGRVGGIRYARVELETEFVEHFANDLLLTVTVAAGFRFTQ